jgi:hypothetical protein
MQARRAGHKNTGPTQTVHRPRPVHCTRGKISHPDCVGDSQHINPARRGRLWRTADGPRMWMVCLWRYAQRAWRHTMTGRGHSETSKPLSSLKVKTGVIWKRARNKFADKARTSEEMRRSCFYAVPLRRERMKRNAVSGLCTSASSSIARQKQTITCRKECVYEHERSGGNGFITF